LAILRVLAFLAGATLVVGALNSAVKTFILPRGAPEQLTRFVFIAVRRLFNLRLRRAPTYADRDRVLALYAPVGLLGLPAAWLLLVLVGYTAMYWALGAPDARSAFTLSGSSLLTLGFAAADDLPKTVLSFTEAAVGLFLVAILISYLPTMYAAFARRETAVTLLEVRAGSPPSAVEMILRHHRLGRIEVLHKTWEDWEIWFADIEESHSSLAALIFFRSPRPERSWVTAAGAVMDAAALVTSTVDLPHDPAADLCIRAGYLALRHISDFFYIAYDPDPKPTDPISITRAEYDAACDELAANGVPLKPDRDQSWRDFAGWRVNYDTVLLALAALTAAPPAPWSSDRAGRYRTPLFVRRSSK
jgi:hypothetical protein